MFTNLKKQIKFEIWTHTSSVGLNATHKNQIAPWGAYTPPAFFRWDILVIFCWDISVICLAVVLKLSYQCSLAYIFSHLDRNGLIFFSHFKKISVCDRKKQHPTHVGNFLCTDVILGTCCKAKHESNGRQAKDESEKSQECLWREDFQKLGSFFKVMFVLAILK